MRLAFVRHLLSVAALPFVVTVVVPVWVSRRFGLWPRAPQGALEGVALVAGLTVLAAGLTLFGSSLRRFVSHGDGTLAPWDPPRHLMIVGPYRFVRHPMISGVVTILAGEALALWSRPHALWAMAFLALNVVYIPLVEEPMLRARFGAAYDEYRRHVPGLIPRLTPWHGSSA